MGHPLNNIIWRKSSYSGSNGGDCVEVAVLPERNLAVRDSKDPDGPRPTFTAAEWWTFTAALKTGAPGLR
jgi:predicted secreted hydrolase